MKRRAFVRSLAAVPALASVTGPSIALDTASTSRRIGPHVIVVGAGAFGGWTALHLLRRGARVTLIDQWGPGNARASSGGETRVIRHAYTTRIYVDFVARSLELWRESSHRWNRPLYHETGVLFMAPDDSFVGPAHRLMEAAGVEHEVLETEEIARRFPQINPEGMALATWEPRAGFLLARRGCEAVLDAFRDEGGTYREARARPGNIGGGEVRNVILSDGTTLVADTYVFACGPWLGRIFPDVIGNLIHPTRQEVFYFGTPAGDTRFTEEHFPVWADMGSPVWYGIPDNENRGFKVADDTIGPQIDPTTMERIPTAAGLKAARKYMEFRFPALKGAPLLDARVCQYEETPDKHLIVDRHPRAENLWIAGGGSGHGYKFGPALGEHVVERILDGKPVEPLFRLGRFVDQY